MTFTGSRREINGLILKPVPKSAAELASDVGPPCLLPCQEICLRGKQEEQCWQSHRLPTPVAASAASPGGGGSNLGSPEMPHYGQDKEGQKR